MQVETILSWIAARRAARARARMGEPRRNLEGVAEGERVVLTGCLEASGSLCARFEDGEPSAVATVSTSLATSGAEESAWIHEGSARAERLALHLVGADKRVEIAGPVQIVAGSREVWTGAGIHNLSAKVGERVAEARHDGPAYELGRDLVFLSLRPGVQVRASGVLVRGGGSVEGYRSDAAPWVLRAASERTSSGRPGAVLLAFEGTPQTRGRLYSHFKGVRSSIRGTVIAVIFILFFVLAGGAAILAGNTPFHPDVAQSRPPRPPRDFGDRAKCEAITKQYKEALDEANHCDRDDDCMVELRGEQWFELDGCERYRSSKLQFTRGDALARQWAEAGCAHDFELCNRVPGVMCRQGGRCGERPPSPLPETWVRHDVIRVFSLYLPPDLKEKAVQGEDSLVKSWESDRLKISLDYGEYSDSLDLDQYASLRVLENRLLEIGGRKAKIVRIENPPGRGFFTAVHFPEVPCNVPFLCWNANQTARLTIYGFCDKNDDCDAAVMSFRSIVFW